MRAFLFPAAVAVCCGFAPTHPLLYGRATTARHAYKPSSSAGGGGPRGHVDDATRRRHATVGLTEEADHALALSTTRSWAEDHLAAGRVNCVVSAAETSAECIADFWTTVRKAIEYGPPEKQDELVVLAMPWVASLEEYPAMRALDKELDLAAGVSVHFGKTVSMLHSHPGYDGDAARRSPYPSFVLRLHGLEGGVDGEDSTEQLEAQERERELGNALGDVKHEWASRARLDLEHLYHRAAVSSSTDQLDDAQPIPPANAHAAMAVARNWLDVELGEKLKQLGRPLSMLEKRVINPLSTVEKLVVSDAQFAEDLFSDVWEAVEDLVERAASRECTPSADLSSHFDMTSPDDGDGDASAGAASMEAVLPPQAAQPFVSDPTDYYDRDGALFAASAPTADAEAVVEHTGRAVAAHAAADARRSAAKAAADARQAEHAAADAAAAAAAAGAGGEVGEVTHPAAAAATALSGISTSTLLASPRYMAYSSQTFSRFANTVAHTLSTLPLHDHTGTPYRVSLELFHPEFVEPPRSSVGVEVRRSPLPILHLRCAKLGEEAE